MERLVVDIFGTGVGYFVVLLFYGTFWTRKNIRNQLFVGGIVLIAAVNTGFTTLFINTVVVTIATFASVFALSFFFVSGISYKLLNSTLITAIIILSEVPIGVLIMQILGVSAEQLPSTTLMYFLGVSMSKLFSLFIVCIIRFFWKSKNQESGRQFNILMVFVAVMPILISLIVVGYMAEIYMLRSPLFGIATVIFSLLSVFVIMYIINNQLRVIEYNKQNEMARVKSEIQIEHYQKLYQTQNEVRAIRHDLCNSLTALSGVLRDGNIDGALEYIEGITSDALRTTDITSTGLLTVDAVLSTKIARADEHGLRIVHAVNIESDVLINQIDLGIVVATALDNAIEGVQRSGSEDKTVILDIASVSDYISVLVENPASAPINERFETSKSDKANHGFGMKQMANIAKKYNGTIHPEYKQEAGRFYLGILMENKPE